MAGIPLLSRWRLSGDLTEEMTDAPASFILPGANALVGFAELLGDDADDAARPGPDAPSVPFALPAMLPDGMTGEASLSAVIDFGRLRGDHAMLTFDALCGAGDVLLDGERLASFGGGLYAGPMALTPCALALDLTAALHLGRRQVLTLRFTDARPAGVPGPVMLRVTRDAFLRRVSVLPDSANRTLLVRAEVYADAEGAYLLEAQPAHAQAASVSLRIGERMAREVELVVPMPGELFAPGVPCDAPPLKLTLWRRAGKSRPAVKPQQRIGLFKRKSEPVLPEFARMPGKLCDSAVLLCGYPGEAARAWVPLTAEDCLSPAPDLCAHLSSLGVTGVLLPRPASDALYRELTRRGIGVRQLGADTPVLRDIVSRYPCVSLASGQSDYPSLALSAWQLGGVVGQLRAASPELTEADMLNDIFGKPIDPATPGVRDVLHWLRAVHVRLLCEAARQQRYTGPLCAPGEWANPDIADAMRTALAKTHLSALPLLGAWWTGSGFSASVYACIGEDYGGQLSGEAVLETESGDVLAREVFACPRKGGNLGVLRASLPHEPCVLTLHTRLFSGKSVIEESAMPIYTGERGPLEAALP